MYAKYIDEDNIVMASRLILHDGNYYANPNEATLKKIGFKELVVEEQPETGENQYLVPKYKNNKKNIVQKWEVKTIETPVEDEVKEE